MMVKVHTKDIKIGMYVTQLDRPWSETDFPPQGFFIENYRQIKKLQKLCGYVQVDATQKYNFPTLKYIKAATAPPKTFAAIPSENGKPVTKQLPDRNQAGQIIYDPQAALKFFQTFGTAESVAPGTAILTEGQKGRHLLMPHNNKMYLLVQGEVIISIAHQKVGLINPGEIFGELTPLVLSERSATAITNGVCKLISLDENQLVTGIKQQPEFSLMLMSLLVGRLRQSVADAKASRLFDKNKVAKGIPVFNDKSLRELTLKLGDDSVIYTSAQNTIFRQGGVGTLMYVILKGRVTVGIDGNIVEQSGPGCIIGEIALVDQKRRTAYAVAETDCALLAISRAIFLDLVKNQPNFGLSLLRALAARLLYCRTGHAP